jgi:excinuclease UvrABC nuclease subunit
VKNLINFKYVSAVYELLGTKSHQYNFNDSYTVYIGSTKNIYKRLNSYISGFAHSVKLKEFMQNNIVQFRIIQSSVYKELEKDILDAFFSNFGEYPVLNINRVL